jgi:hypothetical protein
MAYRDTVKPWFETGDKPTQAQFYQLFDYLRFLDDAIAMNNIADLVTTLAAKSEKSVTDAFEQGERITFEADGYYDIPAGYLLETAVIIPGSDTNISVGTTFAGNELIDTGAVTNAAGEAFVLNQFAKNTLRIYFTGLNAGSAITFLKRKIKLVA